MLNQWRVYGRGNAPLSIEFDTKSIGPDDWENYSFDIVPIIYDREIQEKIVIAAIDSLGAAFSGEEFTAACADWCSQMKHPQFHVEEEWRLSIRWGLEHRTYAGLKHRGNADGIAEPKSGMGQLKKSDSPHVMSAVCLTADMLLKFCQRKKIIHRGIIIGNGPQHEEWMIAGFSIGSCPLLGC